MFSTGQREGLSLMEGPSFFDQNQSKKGRIEMEKKSRIMKAFENVKQQWFNDLPVINLERLSERKRTRRVLDGIRACMEKNTWEIEEDTGAQDSGDKVEAYYDYGGGKILVSVSYSKSRNFIEICAYWGDLPPKDYKAAPLVEMLNLLNARFSAWHFFAEPKRMVLTARAGIFVTNYLNLQALFLLLRHMAVNMYIYLHVINECLTSDRPPMAILDRFDEKRRKEAEQYQGLFE
jgi:hypothetical protein